jgi:hypothetical protein
MVLYKYTSAQSGLQILEGLSVKVSPPNEFNDPFELMPLSRNTIDTEYIIKRAKADPEHVRPVYNFFIRDGYRHSFEHFLRVLPNEMRQRKGMFRSEMQTALTQFDAGAVDEASKVLGILCLSATKTNNLMWSHYAKDHTGMVIGLNAHSTSFSQRMGIDRVKYRKHRAMMDPRAGPFSEAWSRQLTNTVLTKSKDWSYEKEFRMVFKLETLVEARSPRKSGGKNYFVPVKPDDVIEVVLGCRVSPKTKAKIRRLLAAKRFSHTRLFQAQRHRKEFALEFLAVPIARRQGGFAWVDGA